MGLDPKYVVNIEQASNPEQILPEETKIDPKMVALVVVGVWLGMVIWMKSTGRRPLLWR